MRARFDNCARVFMHVHIFVCMCEQMHASVHAYVNVKICMHVNTTAHLYICRRVTNSAYSQG